MKRQPPSQKPPVQKAGAQKRNMPGMNVPRSPHQTNEMESISWSIDAEAQRSSCVSLEDLLSSQPVGCYATDPHFVILPSAPD